MAVDGEDEQQLASLSRALAWLFLLGFLFVSSAARGVYSSHGVVPSARFEVLARVGLLTFLWYWVQAQCRPNGVSFPLDLGLFLSGLWFLMLPYYLWRSERWRGLLKVAVLGAAAVFASLVSIVVHYLLVSGQG